jgi:6-phosphogluconolactonase
MAESHEFFVYAGTYTGQKSKGIYAYRFDASSGVLKPLGLAIETSNPSFLAAHPNNHFLYAVGENNPGTISAFEVDAATGKLKLINTVSSRGDSPCHLALDKTGRWLFVANYGNGSIASFAVRSDGSLGEAHAVVQHSGSSVNPRRQAGPHAHAVNISSDNRFLAVADLGLDQIVVYRFDAKTGALTSNNPPFTSIEPGSGPRHLVFSTDAKFAWVLNEMKNTVTSLSYDGSNGVFKSIGTAFSVPQNYAEPTNAAEIAIHPNHQFLYTSNRGHNSIAIFDVDAQTGLIRLRKWISTRGSTPRNFVIDPSAAFLLAANQDSDSLAIYRIDSRTGDLVPHGELVDAPVPVSLAFVGAPR